VYDASGHDLSSTAYDAALSLANFVYSEAHPPELDKIPLPEGYSFGSGLEQDPDAWVPLGRDHRRGHRRPLDRLRRRNQGRPPLGPERARLSPHASRPRRPERHDRAQAGQRRRVGAGRKEGGRLGPRRRLAIGLGERHPAAPQTQGLGPRRPWACRARRGRGCVRRDPRSPLELREPLDHLRDHGRSGGLRLPNTARRARDPPPRGN
jgi:hypothetical protein